MVARPVQDEKRLCALVVGARGGFCEPYLRKLLGSAQWRVEYRASSLEAEEALADSQLDLVVTDLREADGTGLDLLVLRDALRLDLPIWLAVAPELGARELAASPLRLLPQEFDPDSLRRQIRWQAPSGVGVTRLRVGDYLYAACLARLTVLLYSRLSSNLEAAIKVVEGEIWSCTSESEEGWEAISRLVSDVPRTMRVDRSTTAAGARNVHVETQPWLLRALGERREDSHRAAGRLRVVEESPPASDRARAPSAGTRPVKAEDLDLLLAAGFSASLARNWAGALAAFEAAASLAPEDLRVRINLKKAREKLGRE